MQIKQLKHQLEDQAQATQIALKAKKQQEVEIQEIQTQYDVMVRTKVEVTCAVLTSCFLHPAFCWYRSSLRERILISGYSLCDVFF